MAEKFRQMQKLSITQLKPVIIFLNNIFFFSHELTVWTGTSQVNLPTNAGDAGDMGLILGSGRSPRIGNGNPLNYSCLGNPMDREPAGPQSMGSPKVRHD